MPHLSRPSYGSDSKSSEISRTPLPFDPSTNRRLPKHDVLFVDSSRPSTPEDWVLFAQMNFGTSGRVPDVVRGLADIGPNLLEFLISDNDIRGAVRESICGNFPTTRNLWFGGIHQSLFQRFLAYFDRIPPDSNLVDRTLDEACRQIPSYISIISSLGQVQDAISEDSKAKITTRVNRKGRGPSGGARARRNTATIDPRLFTAVDLQYPTTTQELRDIETQTLRRLRVLLEVLLGAFEKAELGEYAQKLVFDEPSRQGGDHLTPSGVNSSIKAIVDSDSSVSSGIEPLTVVKYFDGDSGLGAWSIILSGRAVSDLRHIQKRDSHVFAMVDKKITELSHGFFSDSNQKRLVGLDIGVPIYEAKVSRDIRIVYQIDLDTDVDAKTDKQIIRIYGVFTHAQLDNRLWSLISCLYRQTPRTQGQNVTPPAYFPHEEADTITVSNPALPPATLDGSKISEADLLKLHSMIALEKFIPMSKPLIDIILNDPANQVFQVSAKEKEIIYYNSACFVLGRSGTGKTTTIVFKMIGVEKAFETMNAGTKPRQVFVTQSRVLARKVQEYYQSLINDPPDPSNESSKLLEDKEDILADLDDEDASAFGLPPKYSMLEDHHFPLFVNFDQLCSLLEADFGLQVGHITSTKPQTPPVTEGHPAIPESVDAEVNLDRDTGDADERLDKAPLPVAEMTRRTLIAKQVAVTFEVFIAAYWPHFNQGLLKGLDPALVYSEFLGVIEGSERSLESDSGALSREEYMRLSRRKSLLTSQRSRVYDLYEAYRKRKHHLGGYDIAERTQALVAATNKRVPGPKLDCLYIDEAQDNLLIDMKLLRNLSNNPHGIFVAGDTAQTISAGSSFRFEDLKAYMWRLEEKDSAVACGKRKAIHPAMFHLAVNYRSHSGVVDCASSITQLISELFPSSIDTLKKEIGIADGPKPIFFSGPEHKAEQFGQFFGGGAKTQIVLGASQAILVRDKAAQNALRAQFGDIGLIFTIFESKGLEFDDVLLYNFFEDSAASESTWRVILRGLDTESIGPVPEFNEIRHGIICRELKNLYVGLTRTRNRCWIWDLSEKARSMKLFWRKKNLLKECGPNDDMSPLGSGYTTESALGEWILPASSTEADWEETGRKLFDNRLYTQAMFCFRKANMLVEHDIAAAYDSRKRARFLQGAESSNKAACHTAFGKAGDDFLGCAILAKGKQQTSCYLRAAECYLQAEEWTAAAEAYYSANDFETAAETFRRAGSLDEALEVVKNREGGVEENIVDVTIEVSQPPEPHTRLEWCVQRKTVERALRGLWKMFPFGITGDERPNAAVGLLITQLSDIKVLTEEESRELRAFQALCTDNVNEIAALAHPKYFSDPESQTPFYSILALLCFSRSSNQLLPHKKSTIPEFVLNAKLASSYIGQLVRFSQSLDISLPCTQMLLGFEPVERAELGKAKSKSSDYLIHSTSQMYAEAQKRLNGIVPRPSTLGLVSLTVPKADAHNLALKVVHDTIRSEVRKIHHAANSALYLCPCLEFAIFGRCRRLVCRKQEVDSRDLPDDQRQELFNQRTRALVIQIQIIHGYPVNSYANKSERRDFRRVWARNLYESLMPHFPPLGSNVCVDPRRVPELSNGINIISTWCEDALQELDPMTKFGLPNQFLSDVLVHLDISLRINRRSHIPTLHSRKLARPREDLMVENLGADSGSGKHSLVHDFINFYDRKSQGVIACAIRAVKHIVFKPLTIEANVLVNILEFIGREIVVQWRLYKKDNGGAFNQLLLPRSWALEVVTRPPLPSQKGITICDFMHVSYKTLELLHGYNPGSSPLYEFNGSLGPLLRSILIMRICRLIVLVAHNTSATSSAREEIHRAVSRSLNGPGDINPTLCAQFLNVSTWKGLWNAVRYSALNRGADELVYLSRRRAKYKPPRITAVKLVVYSNIHPELERLLSLVGPDITLAPRAKLPTSGDPTHANVNAGKDAAQLNRTRIVGQPDSLDFMTMVKPQANFSSTSEVEAESALEVLRIKCGKSILFCYRRYAISQRAKMKRAVKLISGYYLRHRLRHQTPVEETHARVWRLHDEYKSEISRVGYLALNASDFRNHERILLGLMPHVSVYLSGLARVNQQQKEANEERLKNAAYLELDGIWINLGACATISRTIEMLVHHIAPTSPTLYKMNTLIECVKQVDLLRSAITHTFGEGVIPTALENHYPLGISVILSISHCNDMEP